MLIILNSYLIDPASGTEGKRDILIDNGRIVKIEKHILPPSGAAVIDADGMIVCPGLIDTHSHFRDPGFTYKEDLSTGADSAVKGGYTTVILMANTNPPVDRVEILQDILERGRELPVRLLSCANVTLGMAGQKLADLRALAGSGAAGFTDDGLPIMDSAVLKSALEIAKSLDLPVSLHEEDKSLISENGVNGGGRAAAFLGLTGSPREAEYTLIARDGEKWWGVASAWMQGWSLRARRTYSTPCAVLMCWRQRCASSSAAISTSLAIIRGLQDGTIDIIATDHAPHSMKEKEKPFVQAPSGMIGLETALSLAVKNLVHPGYLTMMQMLACLTCNPADFYHLDAGRLEPGTPADLTIFDPDEEWIVPSEFASRSCNSPFIGDKLPGVVHYTIVGGEVVYRR